MFQAWPAKARAIVDELCADLRFVPHVNHALFYPVNRPGRLWVRIGWPDKGRQRNIPMAILILKVGGRVRLMLRVGRDSGLIGETAPLHPTTSGSDSPKDWGSYDLSSPADVTEHVFDWLGVACAFTRTSCAARLHK